MRATPQPVPGSWGGREAPDASVSPAGAPSCSWGLWKVVLLESRAWQLCPPTPWARLPVPRDGMTRVDWAFLVQASCPGPLGGASCHY